MTTTRTKFATLPTTSAASSHSAFVTAPRPLGAADAVSVTDIGRVLLAAKNNHAAANCRRFARLRMYAPSLDDRDRTAPPKPRPGRRRGCRASACVAPVVATVGVGPRSGSLGAAGGAGRAPPRAPPAVGRCPLPRPPVPPRGGGGR